MIVYILVLVVYLLLLELLAIPVILLWPDLYSDLQKSSLFKNLPIDFLKIDGGLVRNMADDMLDEAMVHSINEIGHLTGKLTIAEFAENAEIIQMLTSLGVDYAQGYGVAQPQRVLKAVNA